MKEETNKTADEKAKRELLIGLLVFERANGYTDTREVNAEIVDEYLKTPPKTIEPCRNPDGFYFPPKQ